MLNQISNRARVYKQRRIGVCPRCEPGVHYLTEKAWVGLHPQLGIKQFDTWREAYDYVRTRVAMINYGEGWMRAEDVVTPLALAQSVSRQLVPKGYDERHEENVWRAKHGLEQL